MGLLKFFFAFPFDKKMNTQSSSKHLKADRKMLVQFTPEDYFDLQLTKESRNALQAGEHINRPTLTQEYSNLDKAARGAEAYLKKRLEEMVITLRMKRSKFLLFTPCFLL